MRLKHSNDKLEVHQTEDIIRNEMPVGQEDEVN